MDDSRELFETMPVGKALARMAIPTIISGIYGMNVEEKCMPFAETPFGFGIICGVIFLICLAAVRILRKRKML